MRMNRRAFMAALAASPLAAQERNTGTMVEYLQAPFKIYATLQANPEAALIVYSRGGSEMARVLPSLSVVYADGVSPDEAFLRLAEIMLNVGSRKSEDLSLAEWFEAQAKLAEEWKK